MIIVRPPRSIKLPILILTQWKNKRSVENFYFWVQSNLFPSIVECDAAQNCNGQGICGLDGSCECNGGFFMEDCSSKLKKWYFVSTIVLTFFEKKLFLWSRKNCAIIRTINWNSGRSELVLEQNVFLTVISYIRTIIIQIGKNNWDWETYRKS